MLEFYVHAMETGKITMKRVAKSYQEKVREECESRGIPVVEE